MKKKVLLLLANGFETYEPSVFIDVIGWNLIYGDKSTELFSCSLTGKIKSTFNLSVKTDFLLKDIDVNEYEALAIPGGFEKYGFYIDSYNKDFLNLIKKFFEKRKIIASICVSALPISKSGILKNKKVTTYNLMGGKRQNELKKFGVNVINKPIVNSDNIITSWNPSTALDVAFLLLEELTSKKQINDIRKIMGFEVM
jgi:4-methyl-5(b-hydroxyethyl)-thiazole monophosphate biosynthesis